MIRALRFLALRGPAFRYPALRCWAVALVLLAGAAAAPTVARAQALVADLSDHLIAITTGFIGTDVLLFGAIEGPGDVVVVIRGPNERETVRRKGRVAGIWVNESEMTFLNVPAFYSIATSKPLSQIMSPATRLRHEIGFDTLRMVPAPPRTQGDGRVEEFRRALIRNKQRAALYVEEPGRVVFLGARLFRTRVYFPSSLPTGSYVADVYLVRDGAVVSAQSTPLSVSKVGFGAEVYDFAHRWPMLYGFVAVVVALFAGWLAGIAFHRR